MHVHNKRLTTFYVFLELTIVTHKSINVSDFFEKEIRILRKIQKISIKDLKISVQLTVMMMFRIIILIVSCSSIALSQRACDSFSLGQCNKDEDGLIWTGENVTRNNRFSDFILILFQFPDKELCQSTCDLFSECHFFFYTNDGVCKLYR